MKNYFLFAIGILCTGMLHAQVGGYTFSKLTGTYTELPASKTLITSAWPGAFSNIVITQDLDIDFFGIPTDASQFRVTSRGYIIYAPSIPNGEFTISGIGAELYGVANFNAAEMSYLVEGSYPNRILKVEVKGAGFVTEAQHKSTVTYQVWLYEAGDIVEMHYGPSDIQSALAYPEDIGLFHLEVGTSLNSIEVFGDPANPTVNSGNVVDGHAINSVPAVNTIYRFAPGTNGVHELPDAEKYVNAFYDPSGKTITMTLSGNLKTAGCEICSISGQTIYRGTLNEMVTQIPAGNFVPGLYIIRTVTDKGITFKKIMIN